MKGKQSKSKHKELEYLSIKIKDTNTMVHGKAIYQMERDDKFGCKKDKQQVNFKGNSFLAKKMDLGNINPNNSGITRAFLLIIN